MYVQYKLNKSNYLEIYEYYEQYNQYGGGLFDKIKNLFKPKRGEGDRTHLAEASVTATDLHTSYSVGDRTYTLGKMLDTQGAQGGVWEGTTTINGKIIDIIVKKYIKFHQNDFEDEQLCLRELKDICENYVVCYMDAFTHDNNFYIVMENLKGYVTMSNWIKGTHTPEKIKIIMELLKKALENIHKKNVVHRDLKPDNIMIDDNLDKVKIIDFGLSCFNRCEYTQTVGTPQYIPPPRPNDKKETDMEYYKKSDYWSLGLSLMEIIFNKPFVNIILHYSIKKDIDFLMNVIHNYALQTLSRALASTVQNAIENNKDVVDETYTNVKSFLQDGKNLTVLKSTSLSHDLQEYLRLVNSCAHSMKTMIASHSSSGIMIIRITQCIINNSIYMNLSGIYDNIDPTHIRHSYREQYKVAWNEVYNKIVEEFLDQSYFKKSS